MKKFILSGAVVLAFGLYVIRAQSSGNDAVRVVAPISLQNNPTPQTTTNQTPTSTPQQTPIPAPKPTSTSTPTSDPTPAPTPIPTPTPPPPIATGQYKNGQYQGSIADAYYGLIQVRAIISSGKITDVIFLQYPNDRQTSIAINSQAMPYLRQEAIQAQSASVNIVSGATDTSMAFRQSLASALALAK